MKDPDRKKAENASRRARQYGTGGGWSPQQWRLIYHHYGYRCLCCQAQDKPISADHVVPLSRGGNNSPLNIQPLCWDCDQRKGARIMDYRPLKKIQTLRDMLDQKAAARRAAKARRRERIVQIIAWACLASPGHYRRFIMTSNTTDQTTGAAGSTVARYDTPITTLEQMAAALDRAGVSYDDDSLAACFETFGNSPGYVVQLHAHHEVFNQMRAFLTMGAAVLGWADSAPIVAYVEGQMAAAGLDMSRDVPAVELLERAWIYMADGMGPIDAYWQATADWEDQELAASDEQAQWREELRERSAQARERYRAAEKAHRVEWVKAHEAPSE